MRKLITLLLLITVSPVLIAGHNFPPAIVMSYEKIGAAPGDDLDTIKSIYEEKVDKLNTKIEKLGKTHSLNQVTTDGNVYSLNRGNDEQELKRLNDQKNILKKEISKLDEAYERIVKYFKNTFGIISNLFPTSYFHSHTDTWVNESEVSTPQDYLELNWKALDPRAKAAFKTIVPTELEMKLDERVNTKVTAKPHYYIDYDKIKIQIASLKQTDYTIEQIDLLREIILLQIYGKKAFKESEVLAAVAIQSPERREFLLNSLIFLLQNKGDFISSATTYNPENNFENEFKYFLNLASNAKNSDVNSLLERARAYSQLFGNNRGVTNYPLSHSIYYKNYKFDLEFLNYQTDNELQRQASGDLSRLRRELARVNDGKGLAQYLTSLFAPHIHSINSQEGLGLFVKLLWKTTTQLRAYEDRHINNIPERELFEMTRDIETKMQLIPFAHQVDDDFINEFVNEEHMPTLRDKLKALPAQVPCGTNFKDIIKS